MSVLKRQLDFSHCSSRCFCRNLPLKLPLVMLVANTQHPYIISKSRLTGCEYTLQEELLVELLNSKQAPAREDSSI